MQVADGLDVALADPADEHEIGLARHDVLRNAAFLLVVLAASAAADVDRAADLRLRVRRPQFCQPTGAHRVGDDAVAESQHVQVAACGQDSPGARQVLPVRRRRREFALDHLCLDFRNLFERPLRRPENRVVRLRRFVPGIHVRWIFRRQRHPCRGI